MDAVPRVFVAGRGLVDPVDVGSLHATFGATSIEHWTVGEAVAQARRWRERVAGARPFVSCELSAAALREREVDRLLEQALEAHAITPEQVRLVIAGATLLDIDDRQHDALVALRLRGVEVGVTHVTARFPWEASGMEIPSFAVIDTSSVGGDVADETHRRGLAVVAAGIDSDDHACRWRRCSDLLVGQWYSPAVGPEVITAMLRSGRRLIESAER